MLRVKIEYIPHGDFEKIEEIGSMVITNTGTGNRDVGDYEVRMTQRIMGSPEVEAVVGYSVAARYPHPFAFLHDLLSNFDYEEEEKCS